MRQVQRRQFLIAVGAGSLVAALPSLAQQQSRVRRIGYLSGSTAQNNATWLAAFKNGMAELHWIEGHDYVIDARYANGVAEARSRLSTELVASQPDILLASGEQAVVELAQKTKTIPIVFAIVQNPLGLGVVASLQRPGGNATGLTTTAGDLGAKQMQLLKEAFPRVANVILLIESTTQSSISQAKIMEETAARLKMRLTTIGLRQVAELEGAFKRGAALGAQAYVIYGSGIFTGQFKSLADRLLRARVPSIFIGAEYVDAGGLMSYGPSQQDNFRRAAGYVDKILKGAKPGDLPIEQPTKFEFVVNMKTAKAMGLTIPQSVLLQADKVIK